MLFFHHSETVLTMTRYKAASIHLLLSACVLLGAYFFIGNVWYPGKLFLAAAGGDLMKLLTGVDLILGPLVMLIIFDSKKKLIKLDIAIVVLFQAGFLMYGLWSIYTVRPAYIAFVENRFCLVRANEIDSADLAKVTNPLFKILPHFGPVYVGTIEPTDKKTREDILFSGFGGMGLQNLPQYYVPYAEVRQQILAAAKSSEQFKGVTAETRDRMQIYEKNHSTQPVLFLMLINKHVPLIVAVDAKTGDVIELL